MVEKTRSVLFGDADLGWTAPLRAELRKAGVQVTAASTGRDLLELAKRHVPDVVVLDEALEKAGVDVMVSLLRDRNPAVRIILLTPEGSDDPEPRRHLDPWRCLARSVPEADLREAVRSAMSGGASAGRKVRSPVIMCVDDDSLFLKSITRVLRRRGYTVVAYENPEEALEAVPVLKPAMAFLDVRMPVMDGLDMVAELRDELGKSFPLVLLSAKSSDQEISDGYRSGANYYLTKPCEPQKVVNLADYYVGDLDAGERRNLESQL